MKFIRKEHIVTTIFDKELTKEEEIQIVFKNLYEQRIKFFLTMKKFIPSSYDYINLNFEEVRIKRINKERTLDLIVFKNGAHTNMKDVSFDDIIEINATTIKHKILDMDTDITRFDLLDL